MARLALSLKHQTDNHFLDRGCGQKGSSAQKGANQKTCTFKQSEANCGEDGKLCFCRQCYGRLCNDSPLFKAAQAGMKTVTGTISGLSSLVDGLSKIIRAGMFDVTVANSLSSNSTT